MINLVSIPELKGPFLKSPEILSQSDESIILDDHAGLKLLQNHGTLLKEEILQGLQISSTSGTIKARRFCTYLGGRVALRKAALGIINLQREQGNSESLWNDFEKLPILRNDEGAPSLPAYLRGELLRDSN